MFIYVQASDYDRFLRLDVEPDELVRSVKAKINQELGGNVPEEVIDSLNYVGITLDCSTPLRNYGIEESSLLYIGRNPHAPFQAQSQQQAPIQAETASFTAQQATPISQPPTMSQQALAAQQQQQQQPQMYQQPAYPQYTCAQQYAPQAAGYQAAYGYGYGYPSY